MLARPFSDAEYAHRVNRTREIMAERGIDVLLLFAPESMYYLTGYDSMGYFAYQCLIVPAEGELTLQVRRADVPMARVSSELRDITTYLTDSPNQDPPSDTRQILNERGLLDKRIAFERSRYTLGPDFYDGLRQALSDHNLLNGTDIVFRQQHIKSVQEIGYMRRAGQLADLAIEAAARVIRVGMTEFEVAAEIERTLRINGSEYTGLPIVCSRDPRTVGRGTPSEDRIREDDVVYLELAGCVRRYHAVILRSVAVGTLSPGARDTVKVLVASIQAAIAAVRPGIPIGDVQRARQKVMDEAGFVGAWMTRLGYGVGLAYPPNWLMGMGVEAENSLILQPGMTFTLQPNLNQLEDERTRYMIGDTILVTETGHEVLTRQPWDLRAGG